MEGEKGGGEGVVGGIYTGLEVFRNERTFGNEDFTEGADPALGRWVSIRRLTTYHFHGQIEKTFFLVDGGPSVGSS